MRSLEKKSAFFSGNPVMFKAKAISLISDEEARDILSRLSPDQMQQWREFSSERRRNEWLSARLCEIELRKKIAGSDGSRLRISLTHTSGWVIALGVVEKLLPASIGIDAEMSDRKVPRALVTRITEPSERNFGMSTLELWTAKEACYKANPFSEGTVIPDYRVQTFDPGTGEGEIIAPGASRDIRFALIEEQGLIVALAVHELS